MTSAHQEFALEGYELEIVDYLLKPFSFDRFIKAVNKVLSQVIPNKVVHKYTPSIGKRFHIHKRQQEALPTQIQEHIIS